MILIENSVLRLRTWEDQDVAWYASLIADPDVMHFIGDGSTRTHHDAEREIASFQAEQQQRGWSRWVAELREGPTPIGYIGFSMKQGRIDWGGRSFPRFWGSRGVLLAALLAVEAGIFRLGIPDAVAFTRKDNRGAWRINQSVGFEHVDVVARGRHPEVVQAVSRRRLAERDQRRRNHAMSARLCRERTATAVAA